MILDCISCLEKKKKKLSCFDCLKAKEWDYTQLKRLKKQARRSEGYNSPGHPLHKKMCEIAEAAHLIQLGAVPDGYHKQGVKNG